MGFFRQFSKPTFWSQFVFGMVAIFALPDIYAAERAESEKGTIINQQVEVTYGDFFQLIKAEKAAFSYGLLCASPVVQLVGALHYGYVAADYAVALNSAHPIRAGPIV